ncbi:hypothetical protein SB6094_04445 [Klebsiella quasivariicola]|nr:hypothetical protein SB6094_04445 [Klebsiella quasivariicola]
MWLAKRAEWVCKPRIAALRASSGLRPTVRYSAGSPGKRKRHRGWFPDRSVTVRYSVGSPGKRKRHRGRFPDRSATVRYSVGSPGKRKRHRGWFPDRSVTVRNSVGSPGKRKRHRGDGSRIAVLRSGTRLVAPVSVSATGDGSRIAVLRSGTRLVAPVSVSATGDGSRIAVLRTLSGLQIPLRQPGYRLPPICKTAATLRAVIRRLAAALASASSRVQRVYNTLNTASSPC